MHTRRIGELNVSVVGLGCNNFGMKLDAAGTRAVVDAALDAGITHFDTADIYGGTKSEEYLGQALGPRRRDIVLATKFGMPVDDQHKGARPEYVHSACADSLRRLGTDHIDLYWLHTPDDSVPIAETLGALNELVTTGKVRQLGCSNFSPAQLREAAAEAGRLGSARFVAVQNEYSLLHCAPEMPAAEDQPQQGVLAECQRQGLAFVPYFPLASGLLTGKYRAGEAPPAGSRLAISQRAGRFLNDENMAKVERLLAWLQQSGQRSRSLLELALSWLLAQPQVASVIAGATTPEQVRANAAAGAWQLGAAEQQAVRAIVSG